MLDRIVGLVGAATSPHRSALSATHSGGGAGRPACRFDQIDVTTSACATSSPLGLRFVSWLTLGLRGVSPRAGAHRAPQPIFSSQFCPHVCPPPQWCPFICVVGPIKCGDPGAHVGCAPRWNPAWMQAPAQSDTFVERRSVVPSPSRQGPCEGPSNLCSLAALSAQGPLAVVTDRSS